MKKILVVGESCKDIFVYCKAERLAPDLPVPVLSIAETNENPGMAANVERNIKSIYPAVTLYTNSAWETVTKTRYMHANTNHMFIRVDTDHHIPRVKVQDIPLGEYDLVAISDYNKGFLTEEDIRYICEHHDNVFMDTKKILGDWAVGAKYIKINNFEYERSKDTLPKALEDKIIYTKGDQGAFFRGKNYPVGKKVEVKDLSGAGDSFFAALLVQYVQTGDIEAAIRFANECASEVVQHKGVSVIKS
ncbi:MAG: PfkB family carbohydrate kinase [Candidatus Paceibacterota bacterium]|jgi:bifunctional ADP-heptose synthase (sugar kinase/adenylyltransferase)